MNTTRTCRGCGVELMRLHDLACPLKGRDGRAFVGLVDLINGADYERCSDCGVCPTFVPHRKGCSKEGTR